MARLASRRLGQRGRKVRPGPGSGVIWSRERARKLSKRAGGGRAKNAFQITLTLETDYSFDLDAKGLVEHVSLGMAAFFERQLLAGQRPDGFGPLPTVRPRTARAGPRVALTVGLRTGYMARHWSLGPITGGSFSARRTLKPYGGSGGNPKAFRGGDPSRGALINALLDRGVDFQSVRGKAAAELGRLYDEWAKGAVGEVTNPARVNGRAGLLPELRRG